MVKLPYAIQVSDCLMIHVCFGDVIPIRKGTSNSDDIVVMILQRFEHLDSTEQVYETNILQHRFRTISDEQRLRPC